jgi:hypothetical protein
MIMERRLIHPGEIMTILMSISGKNSSAAITFYFNNCFLSVDNRVCCL